MSHKTNALLVSLFATAALTVGLDDASAQVSRRTAGITLRGSTWGWPEGQRRFVFATGEELSTFDGDGFGGWISFMSRVNEQVFVELSLGGVLRTVEELRHPAGTDTYVEAMVPLLLGARVFPFGSSRGAALRPYLSFGAGPYWVADILSIETFSEHEVTVDSRSDLGGYLGAGMDVMFTDWFGLNLDVKRHHVDFEARNEYSGFEYLMGVQFMWGNRRPAHRGRRPR